MGSQKPDIKALARGGRVDDIIAALGHDNLSVREKAAKALGDLGDPRAVGPLIGCLKDIGPLAREKAIVSLGKLGDAKAADTLLGYLDDDNPSIREKAVRALGYLGDTRAVGPLEPLLEDRNILVRTAAEWSLERLTGRPVEMKRKEGARAAAPGRYTRGLCEAAGKADLARVRQFIEKGAGVNEVAPGYSDGSRALHWALYSTNSLPPGHKARQAHTSAKHAIVELLIDSGADVNARMLHGQTQEQRAMRWVNVDVFAGLREVSKMIFGDLSSRADVGLAPLDIATMLDEKDIARLLIDRGADVNARGENAETALHLAAVYGALETAEVLVEAGADTDARTEGKMGETAHGGLESGQTPLQWASRRLEQATLANPLRLKIEGIVKLIGSAGTPAGTRIPEPVLCRECGRESKQAGRFCPFCGAETSEAETDHTETPLCRQCGRESKQAGGFCPFCGAERPR